MFKEWKDFFSLKELEAEEILYILDTAQTMKYVLSQKNKKMPYLKEKSVIMLFYEKNARTRLSYELAAQYLSAGIVDMEVSTNLIQGGNLVDMGRIIDQMGADFIVLRHPMSGSAKLIAENSKASVINAGDGLNENPTQALVDLMTIKNRKGNFKDLKITIVGDLANSRVARSNMWALLKLGSHVTVCGPSTMIPQQIESFGVTVHTNLAIATSDADVIMVLRMQGKENNFGHRLPSLNEYQSLFKVNRDILQNAKDDVIIMHPGPISRGIEISSEVLESKQCLVEDQIANGVATRMAIFYLLSQRGGAMGAYSH